MTHNGNATPTLRGELLFTTVDGWLSQANRLSEREALDLSQVTRCDSAGLSLLMELKRRAQHHGKTLAFHAAPPQVIELAQFFGIDGLLGLSGR